LKPTSAPPRNDGHRFRFAEGTSPRGSTYHCIHTAAHFLFPAAQLSSCLSPAAAASPPLPSPFISRVLPVSRQFLLQAERQPGWHQVLGGGVRRAWHRRQRRVLRRQRCAAQLFRGEGSTTTKMALLKRKER
jgi:hypothetical protein